MNVVTSKMLETDRNIHVLVDPVAFFCIFPMNGDTSDDK